MIMKIHQSTTKLLVSQNLLKSEIWLILMPLVADIGSGLLDGNCFGLKMALPTGLLENQPLDKHSLKELTLLLIR